MAAGDQSYLVDQRGDAGEARAWLDAALEEVAAPALPFRAGRGNGAAAVASSRAGAASTA